MENQSLSLENNIFLVTNKFLPQDFVAGRAVMKAGQLAVAIKVGLDCRGGCLQIRGQGSALYGGWGGRAGDVAITREWWVELSVAMTEARQGRKVGQVVRLVLVGVSVLFHGLSEYLGFVCYSLVYLVH